MWGLADQMAALLRRLLNDNDMTQTDLAQRAGLSEKHVSMILNGRTGFSMDAADRLFWVLGHEPRVSAVERE